MVSSLLLLIGGIGAIAVCAFLLLKLRFGIADFLLLGATFFAPLWLSRLENSHLFVGSNPIRNHWFCLAALTVLAIPLWNRGTCQATATAFRPVMRAMWLLAAILLASSFVNAGSAADALAGVHSVVFVLLPLLAAWSVVRVLRLDEAQQQRVLLTLQLVGLFVGLLSILTALFPSMFLGFGLEKNVNIEQGRAFSALGGAGLTGLLLVVICGVSAGCLFAGQWRLFTAVVFGVCFVGILSTLARGALLAFMVMCAYLATRMSRGFARRALLMVTLAGIILVPTAWHLSTRFSLERFGERADDSLQARLPALELAFRYGFQHPFLGGGWGQVYPVARQFVTRENAPSRWYVGGEATLWKPHTLYGMVFAEAGVPGLLAFLFFFWRLWGALKPPDARQDQYGHGIMIGFRGGLLAFLCIGVYQDFYLYTSKANLLLNLVFFAGIYTAASRQYAASLMRSTCPAGLTETPVAIQPNGGPQLGTNG